MGASLKSTETIAQDLEFALIVGEPATDLVATLLAVPVFDLGWTEDFRAMAVALRKRDKEGDREAADQLFNFLSFHSHAELIAPISEAIN